MNFVLLSFLTNPVLTAASSICDTAASIPLTNHPSINTPSACAIYFLSLSKIVPFGMVSTFLITFSSTISNSAVDGASPCLQPLSMPNAIALIPFPFDISCSLQFYTNGLKTPFLSINPYPTAFPYGNGMVLHFYQQQESSTTKTVHKVINKGLKTYV